jgi:hypothetical protein
LPRTSLARDAFWFDASLLDPPRGELVPFAELLELLAITHDDAVALDACRNRTRARDPQAARARTSSRMSTSWRADRAPPTARRCRPVGWLAKTTCAGT